MDKQIIAALEIADHEVRLLVGQFFNGRLNILKVEKVSHLGVSGYAIMSETHVVDSLKKAIENASRNLGVVIKHVILLVPGVHMKRINKQLRIPITGRISDNDVKRAYKELINVKAPEEYILTNVLMSKYFVNGSSTRKLPIGERCDSLTIEADCYFTKQSIIFPYIKCVENAGLRVIDIVMDDIGFAKEASLLEASIDKPVVAITLNESITKLALFYKGVLVSNDYLEDSISTYLEKIEQTFNVPTDVVQRLLYLNIDLEDMNPSEDPIFIWSTKSQTHTISAKDIMNLVRDDIVSFVEKIIDSCEPIFENLGNPKFVVSGEASEIKGIPEVIKRYKDVDAELYRSTTFGVKDYALTSLIGSFYYYKDYAIFRDVSYSSIDEEEFIRTVLKDEKDEDDSITQKLKNMFFMSEK